MNSILRDIFSVANVSQRKSIILRYAYRYPELESILKRTSIKEGSRIIPFLKYKNVDIFIKDETSLMHTYTYKSLDACVTLAFCLSSGFERITFASGANLGSAISAYAKKKGITTYYFHPATTTEKLNQSFFDSNVAKTVCVDKSEKRIKKLADEFEMRFGIPQVPTIRWRMISSAFRGLEVAEYALEKEFDWIAQTVCAAYGPIGMYEELKGLNRISGLKIPKLFGIQQSANSPMVNAWKDQSATIKKVHVNANPKRYIEPALYNTNPKTYPLLFDLLKQCNGQMESVNRRDYESGVRYIDLLAEKKVLSTNNEEAVREKTGLITLSGILKGIDKGTIKQGESVLCLITGGVTPTDFSSLSPSLRISGGSIADNLETLSAEFELQPAVT